jgi:tRNA threonylcarbamoyladenosine biosynthesis protein TsaB
MPRALAIETSGRVGSVAVVEGDRLVAEEAFPHGLKNAAGIVPILDRLVRARGWTPADVEQLYLSIGPGSFTGLRIGVTLAKTLAMATGAKLVAVPTVQVLAANAPVDAQHLIIVLDAKRDQIFTARFERQGSDWIERETAHLDSLSAMLTRSPRPICLLGEGIPFHEKFVPREDAGVFISPPDTWQARAAVVARIGMKMTAADQFAEAFGLTPMYVRKPEAEEKYEQMHRQKNAL